MTIQEALALFSQEILRVVTISSISLSMVYLFGRMLELIHGFRVKNLLAFFSIVVLNIFYSWYFYETQTPIEFFWEVSVFSSFCILVYVLVGFKLYDRVDHLLDKKIADDVEEKKRKRQTEKE